MSNTDIQSRDDIHDDMLPSYDFSKGVRGKHAKAMEQGYRVIIRRKDGSVEEYDYHLPDGAVMIDPDIRKYFPDTLSVNRALRGLIELIPSKPA